MKASSKNNISYKLSLNVFFRLLKTSVKKKIQNFTVAFFQNDTEILLGLCGAGLIKSFSLNNNGSITIYLRYDAAGASVINNILIGKPSSVKYVSQKGVRNMCDMNKTAWGLLRTRIGVKPLDYCYTNNLGGEFLVYII